VRVARPDCGTDGDGFEEDDDPEAKDIEAEPLVPDAGHTEGYLELHADRVQPEELETVKVPASDKVQKFPVQHLHVQDASYLGAKEAEEEPLVPDAGHTEGYLELHADCVQPEEEETVKVPASDLVQKFEVQQLHVQDCALALPSSTASHRERSIAESILQGSVLSVLTTIPCAA
jgi:hypothetical protein